MLITYNQISTIFLGHSLQYILVVTVGAVLISLLESQHVFAEHFFTDLACEY